MLPQIHLKRHNEGNIVLHPHIHRVADRVELDVLGIGVTGAIDCVIQRQGPLFVFRIAKDELEKAILVILLRILQVFRCRKRLILFILLR